MAYAAWSVSFGEQPSASKWNILGTNDASFNDGTGIAVSAITPEKLLTGTGTTWAYTSYTPTWTNLTVGNAVQASYYKQVGKNVIVRISIVLGTTSSVAGVIAISLPVTAASTHTASQALGTCLIDDNGVGAFPGIFVYASTTTVNIFVPNTSASSIYVQATAGKPGTWNTNDYIKGTLIYEAA